MTVSFVHGERLTKFIYAHLSSKIKDLAEKKSIGIEVQEVGDEYGKRRFCCAFTDGFSAYYNIILMAQRKN